ncbi:BZ3500_MvSof-1268-A1-R1_C039g00065 [Microbotryum saponariae]|uniref:BZ3500_MvSof-1268-A1-R1_C039g00065 protein n=1 Tax=Microbotryum saponariae TaxID=289078 RepID=A0A2X0LS85_9BASI|nr:BZ3500_MvSof-1268-A1-R1_C039g00065 [Microbotryum saponariae]SDA08500.1 BZ3501_MvSof-1269-A2-R1_C33g00120 [Microbotryum saponariae]
MIDGRQRTLHAEQRFTALRSVPGPRDAAGRASTSRKNDVADTMRPTPAKCKSDKGVTSPSPNLQGRLKLWRLETSRSDARGKRRQATFIAKTKTKKP